jgi:hypothetical protein
MTGFDIDLHSAEPPNRCQRLNQGSSVSSGRGSHANVYPGSSCQATVDSPSGTKKLYAIRKQQMSNLLSHNVDARGSGRVRTKRRIRLVLPPESESINAVNLAAPAVLRNGKIYPFRSFSALLLSIRRVGSVIFFSTFSPFTIFNPWRTPSAPGVG